MKRDFNAIVRGFDGAPQVEATYQVDDRGVYKTDEKGTLLFKSMEPVTLKKALFNLIGAPQKSDTSGAEQLARYRIATKIAEAGEGLTEITTEEGAVLLAVAETARNPLIYGLTKKVLDTDPAPPPEAA